VALIVEPYMAVAARRGEDMETSSLAAGIFAEAAGARGEES